MLILRVEVSNPLVFIFEFVQYFVLRGLPMYTRICGKGIVLAVLLAELPFLLPVVMHLRVPPQYRMVVPGLGHMQSVVLGLVVRLLAGRVWEVTEAGGREVLPEELHILLDHSQKNRLSKIQDPTTGIMLAWGRVGIDNNFLMSQEPKRLFKYHMDRNISTEGRELQFFRRLNRWRFESANVSGGSWGFR